MHNTSYERDYIHIHERLLHYLVSGEEIYQISKIAKTSVNKRLLCTHFFTLLSPVPSGLTSEREDERFQIRCKGTTFF